MIFQEIKHGLSKIGLSARKMVKSISRINLNDDLLKSPSGLTYANRADSQSSLVSIDSIASIATPFESTAHGNNTSIFTTPSKRKVPGSPANAFHSASVYAHLYSPYWLIYNPLFISRILGLHCGQEVDFMK